MFSLFRNSTPQQDEDDALPVNEACRPPLKRPGKMTRAGEGRVYDTTPSIIDFLPWAEFLDEEQCLLLDDGVSVGAVYEVTLVATEGRTDARLEQIRDTLEDVLQDSFDEHDVSPWVVQFFCQDEDDADAYLDGLRGYIQPHAHGDLPLDG